MIAVCANRDGPHPPGCGSPWLRGLIHRRSFLWSSLDQILKNWARAARARFRWSSSKADAFWTRVESSACSAMAVSSSFAVIRAS